MSLIVIETPRLYFSQFSIEDAEAFYDMNNDPEVMRYTGDHPFASMEAAKAFILAYTHYEKYGYGRWTIRRQIDHVYLGFCGLKFHPTSDEVDLGYRLNQKYWGKGYATEAAQACLDYGFKELNLSRIIGRAEVENVASIHVLEKIGMSFLNNFDFDGKKGVIYEKFNKISIIILILRFNL